MSNTGRCCEFNWVRLTVSGEWYCSYRMSAGPSDKRVFEQRPEGRGYFGKQPQQLRQFSRSKLETT